MKSWIRKIWNALVTFLCGIPFDKYLHFIAGLVISAFFNISLGMAVCIIPAIVGGLLKEAFDKWTTGIWEWKDFLATSIGGLIIQIFVLFHIWWF